MPSRRRLTDRAAWRVVIPEHRIERRSIGGAHLPGSYLIPASSAVLVESEQHAAVVLAVLAAHVRAKVPPWRPYRAQTLRLARAEGTMVSA